MCGWLVGVEWKVEEESEADMSKGSGWIGVVQNEGVGKSGVVGCRVVGLLGLQVEHSVSEWIRVGETEMEKRKRRKGKGKRREEKRETVSKSRSIIGPCEDVDRVTVRVRCPYLCLSVSASMSVFVSVSESVSAWTVHGFLPSFFPSIRNGGEKKGQQGWSWS